MRCVQGDEALVKETLSGRIDAFTELARRHQDYAYGRAFGIVADFHLAHDVVQESLLAAYQDLPKLRDPSRFRPWLSGIVRHMAHRAVRELGRVSDLADALGEAPGVVAGPPRPGRLVEREERRQQVQAALRRLSGTSRQVVSLYYMDGLSYGDVADLLGVTKTVVQGRLQRAREQLRSDLGTSDDDFRSRRLPSDFAKTVQRLLEAAESRRADRESVSRRLVEMGVHAVPSLCEALDGDPRDSVRTVAGRVLSEIGDPRALRPLLRLLYAHHGRGMQHWASLGFQAADLLRMPGMRECLLETLREETNTGVLWLAFGVLSEARGDPATFDGVYRVFSDPAQSAWKRTQAAVCLCELRPRGVERVVHEAISQPEARVRGAGLRLAARYRVPPPAPGVCVDLFVGTHDWEGRLCAARLLLGHEGEGTSALLGFMHGGSPAERAVATLILAQEGCVEAAQILERELARTDELRAELRATIRDGGTLTAWAPSALRSLSRGDVTRVGRVVEGLLAAGNPGMRVAALKILTRQRGSAFMGELRALTLSGGKVARAAVAEMVKLKSAAAPLAAEMSVSEDPQERRAGAAVLRRIGAAALARTE